jgi:hypothetical protein
MKKTKLEKAVSRKQHYAQNLETGAPDVIEEVLYQIEVCEELYCPLSKAMIEALCQLKSAVQVQIKCKGIKMA